MSFYPGYIILDVHISLTSVLKQLSFPRSAAAEEKQKSCDILAGQEPVNLDSDVTRRVTHASSGMV